MVRFLINYYFHTEKVCEYCFTVNMKYSAYSYRQQVMLINGVCFVLRHHAEFYLHICASSLKQSTSNETQQNQFLLLLLNVTSLSENLQKTFLVLDSTKTLDGTHDLQHTK
jgi:hypothetical protein